MGAPAVENTGVPFFVGGGAAEGGFSCNAGGPLGVGVLVGWDYEGWSVWSGLGSDRVGVA